MLTLSDAIVALLEPFVPLFDARTWRKARSLTIGMILAPRKRTVTRGPAHDGAGQRRELRPIPRGPEPCQMVAGGRGTGIAHHADRASGVW